MRVSDPPDTSGAVVPTATKQAVGFMVGSFLFALGSAPGFGSSAGADAANVCYFVGAWFFTGAALIQLLLSGPVMTDVSHGSGRTVRAQWLAASTQFVGTLLFNVSTTSALTVKSMHDEQRLVWNPDAGGSVAFLVSGWFVLVAFTKAGGRPWAPDSVDWWSGMINFLGCVAFGVSAVGGFLTLQGVTVDVGVATVGTFIGAVCFFLASAIVLPRALRDRPASPDQTALPDQTA